MCSVYLQRNQCSVHRRDHRFWLLWFLPLNIRSDRLLRRRVSLHGNWLWTLAGRNWQHICHQTIHAKHADDRHGDNLTSVGEKHFLHRTSLFRFKYKHRLFNVSFDNHLSIIIPQSEQLLAVQIQSMPLFAPLRPFKLLSVTSLTRQCRI